MSVSMVDDLDGAECAGAWRYLCASMLLQTVQRLEAEAKRDRTPFTTGAQGGNMKETVYQKREARRWIDGGVGVVTFEDCCEALDVDCSRARRMIEEYCSTPGRRVKRNHRAIQTSST